MITGWGILHVLLALFLAPLLQGVIHRVKARFAGRRGRPLLQLYFDLAKLCRKGAVYSQATTWVFRLGPVVTCVGAVLALGLVPLAGWPASIAFPGDLILLAYLLGLGRCLTVWAALDTGSAFEGMGASREVLFAALSEPILLLSLAALGRLTGHLSLSDIYPALHVTNTAALVLPLVAAALLIVLLVENARIPVDDPNTHLELTMIHEVMILDHSGPDLALIEYGAALKLWLFSALLAGVVLPIRMGVTLVDGLVGLGGIALVTLVVGVIESIMARLRLLHVPQLLSIGLVLSVIALMLVMRPV